MNPSSWTNKRLDDVVLLFGLLLLLFIIKLNDGKESFHSILFFDSIFDTIPFSSQHPRIQIPDFDSHAHFFLFWSIPRQNKIKIWYISYLLRLRFILMMPTFFYVLALFEYSFRLLLTRVSRSFAPSLQTISLFNTESHDFLSSSYPINNTEIFLFTLNKWWSDGWRSFVRFVEFKWPDFLWSVKIFGKMFI